MMIMIKLMTIKVDGGGVQGLGAVPLTTGQAGYRQIAGKQHLQMICKSYELV